MDTVIDFIKEHVISIGSIGGWLLVGIGAGLVAAGYFGVDSFVAKIIEYGTLPAGILAMVYGGLLVVKKNV